MRISLKRTTKGSMTSVESQGPVIRGYEAFFDIFSENIRNFGTGFYCFGPTRRVQISFIFPLNSRDRG